MKTPHSLRILAVTATSLVAWLAGCASDPEPVATAPAVQAPSPPVPLAGASVESFLAIAREGSPDVRMVRLEAEAARERIGPAGALPDPFLRVELENITRNGTQGAAIPNIFWRSRCRSGASAT